MVTAKQDSLEAVLFWFSRRSEQVPRLLSESGFVCRERGPLSEGMADILVCQTNQRL